MPLTVTIDLNGRTIDQYHIGRASGGMDPEDRNLYSVVQTEAALWQVSRKDWDEGVIFEHRYGDGASECVRRALEAVRKNRKGD